MGGYPLVYNPLPLPPQPARRWWQHPALVIALLILFPPAGIVLTCLTRWTTAAKVTSIVVSALWFFIVLAGGGSDEPKATTAGTQRTSPPAAPAPTTETPNPPQYTGKTLRAAKTAAAADGYDATSHDASDGDAGQWDDDNWTVCFQAIDGRAIDFGVVRTGEPCPKKDGQPIPWPRMPKVIDAAFENASKKITGIGVKEIEADSAYTDVKVPDDHDRWKVCFQHPEAGERVDYPQNQTARLSLVKPSTSCPSEEWTELHPDPTPDPDAPGGSGDDDDGQPVKRPGAFCSPAGAVAVSSSGTPLVCGPGSDGRNRWRSR